MGKSIRESNFELLRIISILLIMMMHSFGTPLSSLNEYMVIFVSVIGNIGTTCFIIISGYFGVKRNVKKLAKLDVMVITYCLLGLVVDYVLLGEFSLRNLISCVLPIISHRYWFLSCYFFLCILSPYLNEYLDGISRERMKQLILVMLLLFAVLPTLFGFDVMQDGGKGLMNMTLSYIIGRYLGKYGSECRGSFGRRKCTLLLLLLVAMNLCLNSLVFYFTGSTANYYARDNSVFTILEAVLLFWIFRGWSFQSLPINVAASNVVAVYVLEPVISHGLRYAWDYTVLADRGFYLLVVLGVVLGTFLVGMVLELVRKRMFVKLEDYMVDSILRLLGKGNLWKRL